MHANFEFTKINSFLLNLYSWRTTSFSYSSGISLVLFWDVPIFGSSYSILLGWTMLKIIIPTIRETVELSTLTIFIGGSSSTIMEFPFYTVSPFVHLVKTSPINLQFLVKSLFVLWGKMAYKNIIRSLAFKKWFQKENQSPLASTYIFW